MGLLVALVTLLSLCAPVFAVERCSGFRHLENGRTFFRYGGLLVIFSCRPGFKLYGYKTNSCVSGRWARDPPVCVGSGCSDPGPLIHGTSTINTDGSWAVFNCNSGFGLHGPSMLYCKGQTWNSTKPVCREFDMMNSLSGSGVTVQKPDIHQNLHSAEVMKTQEQSQYITETNSASRRANLKFGLLSSPSQMSNGEKIKMTNPKIHLTHFQFPDVQFKSEAQTSHQAQLQEANETQGWETGTGREGADERSNSVDVIVSKSQHTTGSSLDSGPEQPPSSPPSLSASVTTDVRNNEEKITFPSGTRFGKPVTVHDYGTLLPEPPHEDQHVVTDLPASQPDELTDASTFTSLPSFYSFSSSSSPTSSPAASMPSFTATNSNTLSSMKTQTLHVTLLPNTSTTKKENSHQADHHKFPMNTTSTPPQLLPRLSRRPVCPYPPVPTHGTFHFRNVVNPGPRAYRHFIQYACYPGYTLAHGDIHSYCQRDGTWSGITPACLELTPCSVNNGGCSQLCSHSQHYDQSLNRTRTRPWCHCRPGFTLLDDGQTCRDVDECMEGQHQCQQRCINTFGSFMCSCDDGYSPNHDQTSCTDVDECLLPAAVTGCVSGCVNSPGSFHCLCPAGYSLHNTDNHCQDIDECAINQGIGPCVDQCHNSPGSYQCSCTNGRILAGDGHTCVPECPPGYRKQATAPDNSTAQECEDINECLEDKCDWQCVNSPGSFRCICPRGYTLQGDGQQCKDINECTRKNGGCSHRCVNQKGGYKCVCPASHRLSPYSWKKCIPRTTAHTAG